MKPSCCFDSRSPGSWDLADKEIAKLIGDVAAKGPHVAVILDCCHSGSGTREIDTVVRRAPTDLRRRPIESFIVSLAEAEAASASRSAKATGASRYAAPEGRHVLFAACRDDEEAKEYNGDGKQRGAFSFFLGDALKSAAGVPTYRDLFARTSALVSNVVRNQSPQLEVTQNDDLDAAFLDGAIQPAAGHVHRELSRGTLENQRRRDERHPRACWIGCPAACPVPVRCPRRRPERSFQGRCDGPGR